MGVDVDQTWENGLVTEIDDGGIRGDGEIFTDLRNLGFLHQNCHALEGLVAYSVDQASRPDGYRLSK
jgi:hypothetical protein